jgi:carbonic anhydrase
MSMKYGSRLLAISLAMSAWSGHVLAENHWNYDDGHAGPAHWSELEEGNTSCNLGKVQSPIDIQGAKTAKLDPIGFNYAPGAAEAVNNGHTVQVNLARGGSIKQADGDYQLMQLHFHTPSEEKIDGKSFPLSAHLVHKNAQGKLAVVTILFERGEANTALKPVFDAMPAKAGESLTLAADLDPAAILPPRRGYYAYTGSLTTPPCSEGVSWSVLKQAVTLSEAQLSAFQKLYPMNARPVQGLNGRIVMMSD